MSSAQTNDRIYGLVGRRLSHSFSPEIHASFGTPQYSLYELEPHELADFIRRENIGGLNVTIPYKRDVMPLCDRLSDGALAIGSVNTIVRRADGLIYGYNTDADGLLYMSRRANISFEGKKVVIFGSGGASLTAQYTARSGGSREVVVISRSGENNYDNLHIHYNAQILINTTPLGMYPQVGVMPADPALFPNCEGVLDLVYNPRRTAFIIKAQECGIPCSDGLPMLVTQAKVAEELFFDRAISDEENERVLGEVSLRTENIVLIGMPGSGKSSIGAQLSQLSGRTAVDIDQKIAERAGMPVSEIFATQGEEAFRALEREITAETGKQSGIIIMTGGGVIKDRRNYAPLHQNGRIYHIEREITSLDREGRPLSQGFDLCAMYRERLPLYESFRDVCIINDRTVEQAAQSIWEEFCHAHSCDKRS